MLLAVADRFTRTDITYIQITLPPYLMLRDVVKTYLAYLYISRRNRVHSISCSVYPRASKKKLCLVEMCGGGGGLVHGNHK